VVYWTADYFPRRFQNEILNRLAISADVINTLLSEYVWDLTQAITEARRQKGARFGQDKVFIVPHVVTDEEFASDLSPCGQPDSLIYVGQLSPEYGFQLILEALPAVIRERPGTKLSVTSYKPLPDALQEALRGTDVQTHINFMGYIKDTSHFGTVLQKHRIGLAPYKPDPLSWKNFVDASKAKTYMARGLPVIITRVPPIAREIEEAGAGIVIGYDRAELVEAILRLLHDEEFYQQCRVNAFNMAQRYRADRVFLDVFSRMGFSVASALDTGPARDPLTLRGR
jgi:glycosyltransferase involved in cell wall biosynthesis